MAEPDFSKIKRNVKRMIDGGAPEAEIDAYLGHEGVTPDQIKASNETVWRGGVLPFNRDAGGDVHLDWDTGVAGAVRGAFGIGKDYTQAIGDTLKGEPVTEETIDQVIPMGALAAGGMNNPGIRAGEGFMGAQSMGKTIRPAKVATPSAAELKAAGGGGFDAARAMGVEYAPAAVSQIAENVKQQLLREGFNPAQSKLTFGILNRSAKIPAVGPDERVVASLDNLHSTRKSLQKAAQDFNNPTEQAAASIAIKAIDEFITAADPGTVVAGPAAAAGATWKEALGNYAAGMRSKEFSGIGIKAERRAAAANSGKNFDNTIRQRVADVLNSKEKSATYTADEIALMDQFVFGSTGRNRARSIGNQLGGGGGVGGTGIAALGAAGGASVGSLFGPWGTAIGGAVGATVPRAGGAIAKSQQNRMARNEMSLIDDILRQRSPLYKNLRRNAPMEAISPGQRAAIVQGLLADQLARERREHPPLRIHLNAGERDRQVGR